jgi:hypothetical protein
MAKKVGDLLVSSPSLQQPASEGVAKNVSTADPMLKPTAPRRIANGATDDIWIRGGVSAVGCVEHAARCTSRRKATGDEAEQDPSVIR